MSTWKCTDPSIPHLCTQAQSANLIVKSAVEEVVWLMPYNVKIIQIAWEEQKPSRLQNVSATFTIKPIPLTSVNHDH